MIEPAQYRTGTAELALANFLRAWKKREWKVMSSYCQKTWIDAQDVPSDMLSSFFLGKPLADTTLKKVDVVSSTTVDITFTVSYSNKSVNFTKTITARIIREEVPYKPSEKGQWGVNPLSVLRGS